MSAEWLLAPLSIAGMLVPFLFIGLAMAGGAILWGYLKSRSESTDEPPNAGVDPEGGEK